VQCHKINDILNKLMRFVVDDSTVEEHFCKISRLLNGINENSFEAINMSIARNRNKTGLHY